MNRMLLKEGICYEKIYKTIIYPHTKFIKYHRKTPCFSYGDIRLPILAGLTFFRIIEVGNINTSQRKDVRL